MRVDRRILLTLRAPLLVLATLFAAGAQSATVTVRAGTLSEGDANIGFPLNATLFRQIPMRYQQVYAASYFGGLSGTYAITAIAFRTDGSVGKAFSTTIGDVRIDLSTTRAPIDALDMTYAANVGGDVATVFDGPLSLSSAHQLTAGGARAFDVVIRLQTPFVFAVGSGNLLLDIFNYSGGLTSQLDGMTSRQDGMSSLFGSVGANGRRRDSSGLVTQFEMQAIPAPLPGGLWLLLTPLVALMAVRRQRVVPARGGVA